MMHEFPKTHEHFSNLRFVLRAIAKAGMRGEDRLHSVRPGWVECYNGPALHVARVDLPLGVYKVVKNTASEVILSLDPQGVKLLNWRAARPAWEERPAKFWGLQENGLTQAHCKAYPAALKQVNDILHPHYMNPLCVDLAVENMTTFAKLGEDTVGLYGEGRMALLCSIKGPKGGWTHLQEEA